jgi:predicted hydrocarbon binding protein/KaiC/GvpD/RAD55 family RecA-like ATPase
MERRGRSLAEIHEVPKESLVLLSGPPGAGKSTFCHQVVLNGLAMEKPVVYVTTEHGPAEVVGLLREKGVGELPPGALSFVDAFGETVGAKTPERPDTIGANCEDLNSISMAIAKLQERIGRRDVFLAFDSLTSPYLFNEKEVFRFMRLCLAKFASEGNSVLALMDEGCGKEEDLGAMMSVADGILRIEIKESLRIINIVKYPKMEPTRIEVPIQAKSTIKSSFEKFKSTLLSHPELMRPWSQSSSGQAAVRKEVGDFVNLFWPQFARWSAMLWDPKGFPVMIYELNKEDAAFSSSKEMIQFYPRLWAFVIKLFGVGQTLGFLPKSFSKVKDMKTIIKLSGGGPWNQAAKKELSGTIEYLEDISRTDEHHFRVYENSDCSGLEGAGTPIASYLPPHMAGLLTGFEKNGREWNAVETKCIGMGDPYCEFKLVPGEIDELKSSLEKDASVVEKIHEQLVAQIMGFLLHDKPVVDRHGLGSDIHLHPVIHGFGFPYLSLAGEKYRVALRMGGARAGKKVGERLLEAGLSGDEAVKRILIFLEHCKVGKVAMDETIKIKENCESLSTSIFKVTTAEEPCCFFTTGFLNGLFSTVKNQHVREIKCVGAGDPYCEWEIV